MSARLACLCQASLQGCSFLNLKLSTSNTTFKKLPLRFRRNTKFITENWEDDKRVKKQVDVTLNPIRIGAFPSGGYAVWDA
jgi:hypothetical protein